MAMWWAIFRLNQMILRPLASHSMQTITRLFPVFRSARLAGAMCLLAAGGCGGNPAVYPPLAEVSGVVTLDGKPIEAALVTFKPEEGRNAGGETDAEGRYTLTYVGTTRGASLGSHRVSMVKRILDPHYVQPRSEKVAGMPPMPEYIDVIPKRFTGPNSELTVDVAAGPNTIDFALTSGPVATDQKRER